MLCPGLLECHQQNNTGVKTGTVGEGGPRGGKGGVNTADLKQICSAHFMDAKVEAQNGQASCPRPHSYQQDSNLRPRPSHCQFPRTASLLFAVWVFFSLLGSTLLAVSSLTHLSPLGEETASRTWLWCPWHPCPPCPCPGWYPRVSFTGFCRRWRGGGGDALFINHKTGPDQ